MSDKTPAVVIAECLRSDRRMDAKAIIAAALHPGSYITPAHECKHCMEHAARLEARLREAGLVIVPVRESLYAQRADLATWPPHAHENGETPESCPVCRRWREVDAAIAKLDALPPEPPAAQEE